MEVTICPHCECGDDRIEEIGYGMKGDEKESHVTFRVFLCNCCGKTFRVQLGEGV